MCLAQGHNPVTLVRIEAAAPRSRVKYSNTALPSYTLRTRSRISYNRQDHVSVITDKITHQLCIKDKNMHHLKH